MSQSYDNVRVPVHSWVVTPYPGFVHQCKVYFFYLLNVMFTLSKCNVYVFFLLILLYFT